MYTVILTARMVISVNCSVRSFFLILFLLIIIIIFFCTCVCGELWKLDQVVPSTSRRNINNVCISLLVLRSCVGV